MKWTLLRYWKQKYVCDCLDKRWTILALFIGAVLSFDIKKANVESAVRYMLLNTVKYNDLIVIYEIRLLSIKRFSIFALGY